MKFLIETLFSKQSHDFKTKPVRSFISQLFTELLRVAGSVLDPALEALFGFGKRLTCRLSVLAMFLAPLLDLVPFLLAAPPQSIVTLLTLFSSL